MLVLNKLPNVLILNGRSTKDDEEEEEEEENYNNNNFRNNHLYPQMEEIKEDKNMENNSYISSENNNNINNSKENNSYTTNNKEKSTQNNNNSHTETEIVNAYTEKVTITKNINVIDGKEYVQKNIEINKEGPNQQNMLLSDKIMQNNLNKNILNNQNNNIQNNNIKNNVPFYDLKNINTNSSNNKINENFLIDITNEELKLLKDNKYSNYSEFVTVLREYSDIYNNDIKNEENKIFNKYLNELKKVEDKKVNIPNYYYFYLLYRKKKKTLKNIFDEIFPYILNKCPEINRNNILIRLNNELTNTIKDVKDLMDAMHSHIESYNNKNINSNNFNKNNDNNDNLNNIIKEQNNKIAFLESQKKELLKNINDDKKAYEKKISSLESENKIMTQKLLDKANDIIINDLQQSTISKKENDLKLNYYGINTINYKNQSQTPKKSAQNNRSRNINNNIYFSKTRSFDNTSTIENNNSINYLNTSSKIAKKQQLISLKTLKDFINELYISKSNYDIKCIELKLPKETLEEHMYTFLNKKYGLKNLIIDWARNIINGIKYYSKKDSIVLLFGKILRNEQEEDARFMIQKVLESIEELLLYYIKRQNPLKSVNEINKIFNRKKNSELLEEEWKGIIYSIYEKNEAGEIEKKIENFIQKENDKKKIEMMQKYKESRINNDNKYNNNFMNSNNISNTYYFNTINSFNNGIINTSPSKNNNLSYMNTINNTNNNKLSRIEKYNMLLTNDERNILFSDFLKIVLDSHIRFRDRQLKNFVKLFKSVDTNKDGIINEDEFSELIHKMNIFKEDEIENIIILYLEKIDPFDNQKITFSECITFFSGEMIKDNNINGNEKEISVLEKICFGGDKNGNGNMGINNTNDLNKNEQIDGNIEINDNNNANNINKYGNNNEGTVY